MPRILTIDDDENFLVSLSQLLTYKQFMVDTLSNPLQAEAMFRENNYQCVLLDVKMPGVDGLELLDRFQKIDPTVPVVMISGQSTISLAVEAVKMGAFDFIEKPVEAEKMLVTIRNALEKQSWLQDRDTLLSELGHNFEIVGKSPAITSVMHQIEQVAPTDAKVLILGETGTGKELVARALHLHSNRSSKPFLKMNCAAIPSELLESELFGYRKGAFTGASRDYRGKFLEADGGTLFLDEIGDMDPGLQTKLLRALQDGEIELIGEAVPRTVDVRIFTASNRGIPQLVQNNKFRQDLFYRIGVITIRVPPLRERKEDISDLARYFLQHYTESYNKNVTDITPQALTRLLAHDWPGNIRELKNIVEKLVIFAREPEIQAADVAVALEQIETDDVFSAKTLKTAREEFERDYILRHLQAFDWKIQETADALGIDRTVLFRKMKKLGISEQGAINSKE